VKTIETANENDTKALVDTTSVSLKRLNASQSWWRVGLKH